MRSSLLLTLAVLLHVSTLPATAQPTSSGTQGSGPIVLELFTSQGCSSCPPADRLLSRLGAQADVLPLSFHVDYWDQLGWPDPFADRAYSKRQRRYASRFAELVALLRKREIPLVMTAFPDLGDVVAKQPSGIDERVAALAALEDVPFASALQAYREQEDPRGLYLYPLDPHPSARGNEALAEVVADLLRAQGLVPGE